MSEGLIEVKIVRFIYLYVFSHIYTRLKTMVNVTLSIPNELKQKMDSLAEINWSAVAREAFDQKIRDMEFLKNFKAKSTLTEEDALRLGRKVNKALSNRLRNLRK